MARIRTVKPSFWEDEDVACLSRDARLLFLATFNIADDEGLLRWTPAYIKAQVFLYDDDIHDEATARLMAELTDEGFVLPYVGGRARQRLGLIVNFLRHQKINRPQPSKLPAPPLDDPAVRQAYGRRAGLRCARCGTAIPDNRLAVERINASADGSEHPSNVRAAHETCLTSSDEARTTNGKAAPQVDVPDSLNESVNRSTPDAPQLREQVTAGRGSGRGKGKEPLSRTAEPPRDDVTQLCTRLHERIVANGTKAPTVGESWKREARLLLDRDQRPLDEASRLIDWCQADPFWKSNILSMSKFREQYDRLRLKAEQTGGRHLRSVRDQERAQAMEQFQIPEVPREVADHPDAQVYVDWVRQQREDWLAERGLA